MQALQKSSASCNIYWLGDWLYPITILLHSHVVNMINNTPSCYFYLLYFGSVQFILCSDQTTTIVGNGWIFSNKKLRPQLCVCDIWIELSWIERGPQFRLNPPDLIFFKVNMTLWFFEQPINYTYTAFSIDWNRSLKQLRSAFKHPTAKELQRTL